LGAGIDWRYQPVPSSEANGLGDDAMESHKNRLGAVVAGDEHLGVLGQNSQPLVAAVFATMVVHGRRALFGIQHFHPKNQAAAPLLSFPLPPQLSEKIPLLLFSLLAFLAPHPHLDHDLNAVINGISI
jgi:hypothetical protein